MLLASAAMAVSGCSYIGVINHYDLDTQALQHYISLQIVTIEERARRDYRSLGEIRGISCGRTPGDAPNERDAMDQVRLRASQAGAHAITPPICVHSDDIEWSNNCWRSVICSAEILVDQTREPQPEPHTGTSPDGDS
jgi:hypothetical protein